MEDQENRENSARRGLQERQPNPSTTQGYARGPDRRTPREDGGEDIIWRGMYFRRYPDGSYSSPPGEDSIEYRRSRGLEAPSDHTGTPSSAETSQHGQVSGNMGQSLWVKQVEPSSYVKSNTGNSELNITELEKSYGPEWKGKIKEVVIENVAVDENWEVKTPPKPYRFKDNVSTTNNSNTIMPPYNDEIWEEPFGWFNKPRSPPKT